MSYVTKILMNVGVNFLVRLAPESLVLLGNPLELFGAVRAFLFAL